MGVFSLVWISIAGAQVRPRSLRRTTARGSFAIHKHEQETDNHACHNTIKPNSSHAWCTCECNRRSVVSTHKASIIPANNNPAAFPMPKLNVLNWKVIIPIISPITKKAQNASRSVTWTVNRDKADAIQCFYAAGIVDLVKGHFVKHDVVIYRHLNLARMTRLRKQP
nr:PUTATIVE PSEUDOGENE: RecName: Full=Putative protein LivX [Escherichia coli]AAA24077.1 high-affinity branched-chain amino acid transport repressor (livR) [Escherichia coli]CAA35465.1 unnamed protein product [Escherichia coli]prf//1302328A amino acid transport repressor [Escherichia coli]